MSRFAPITAGLLARKGDAMPSTMIPPAILPPFAETSPRRPVQSVPSPPPAAPDNEAHPPHDPSRPKKLFIALSHREHERLAIAAVKTGLSRHQLVRDALESYFEQLAHDLRDGCACMSGAKGCSGACES
jgi:hypothetical protein